MLWETEGITMNKITLLFLSLQYGKGESIIVAVLQSSVK